MQGILRPLTSIAGRALEAPQIRRIFSCSPRDPRYHMLEHLSPKFRMDPVEREPRAALILNRFTRTLSIMFATEAIGAILGVPAEQVQHKSFYECIQESSLSDAFSCLESAKANDSIAYLRFWSRDPRRPEDFEDEASEDGSGEDEGEIQENNSTSLDEVQGLHQPLSSRSSDSEDGGVRLDTRMDIDQRQQSPTIKVELDVEMHDGGPSDSSLDSRTVSSTALASGSNQTAPTAPTSRSISQNAPHRPMIRSQPPRRLVPSVELEAVVSCTSDGLVVVLRRARPRIPNLHPPQLPFDFGNGLFAAPWGQQPIQPQYSPEMLYNFRPPLLPQFMPVRENVKAAGGPPIDQLMSSIRDVAVFAWALVGINGKLASYGHGRPLGEAQPPDGLPIWDPDAARTSYLGPENQAAQRWARFEERQQSFRPAGASFDGSSPTVQHGHYAPEQIQSWLQQPPTAPHQHGVMYQHGASSGPRQNGQGPEPSSTQGSGSGPAYHSSSSQMPPSSEGGWDNTRNKWQY